MKGCVINENMPDIANIRRDFPILNRQVNGKPLVYFDNGATAQKPQAVIDALAHYYASQNSNIHRGVHTLSREITIAYENARQTIAEHLNAADASEIIFTRGTTESINLVAYCFGKIALGEGDEILITEMEHHSNIIPWQMLCEEKKAVLKFIPINAAGELMLDDLEKLVSERTKLVAFTHISNTLGTINPVKEMIARIRTVSPAAILIDGAKAVPHLRPDVRNLDCDFYVFSGHKLFGPTGVGILYAKRHWLDTFPPYQTGGGTIKTVSLHKTEFAEAPLKFEAGTPHIAGGIGLAAAINYVNAIGFDFIQQHESALLNHATEQLKALGNITFYGTATHKTSVLSFNVDGQHPFDVGSILDKYGVAIRSGHHCTQPICQYYGIPGTIRASFAFYNTLEEVDVFVEALKKAIRMLS